MCKSTEMYTVNSCNTLTIFFLQRSHFIYGIPGVRVKMCFYQKILHGAVHSFKQKLNYVEEF